MLYVLSIVRRPGPSWRPWSSAMAYVIPNVSVIGRKVRAVVDPSVERSTARLVWGLPT